MALTTHINPEPFVRSRPRLGYDTRLEPPAPGRLPAASNFAAQVRPHVGYFFPLLE
jgi:hypothetical protein